MSVEFKLPELGENVEAGDVVRVLVAPGDVVTADQGVIELETDKATIEVPVSSAGTVAEVKVSPGDRIAVGQVVLTLDANGAGEAGPSGEKAAGPEPEGESGREVESAESAATPDAAPAPQDDSSSGVAAAGLGLAAGAPAEPPGRDEAREEREQGLGLRSDPVPGAGVTARPPVPPERRTASPDEVAAAAPSVRRLARELGLDINEVSGSGPSGRISAEDVKAFSRAVAQGASAAGAGGGHVGRPLPDLSRWGEVERQKMSGIRRATATHLASAWATIPHVTQTDRADITELDRLRRRYDPTVEAAGGKLTVTAIAIKVVASALRTFPQFNASVDLESEEIVLKRYVHVGVAVDTERGLLVPVIRDADRKNIVELSVELGQLAERARAGKLTLDEMSGGSFTITNLGGIGGSHFSPIVNWPEVAILGVSRATTEPTYVDGELRPRLQLPLSLSYDHRVIDGADGIRFLRWVVAALEQPFLLALEG